MAYFVLWHAMAPQRKQASAGIAAHAWSILDLEMRLKLSWTTCHNKGRSRREAMHATGCEVSSDNVTIATINTRQISDSGNVRRGCTQIIFPRPHQQVTTCCIFSANVPSNISKARRAYVQPPCSTPVERNLPGPNQWCG